MQLLEKLLGAKNKIKLLRFLVKTKDWQFNLAEISKEINVHKGAISKLIRQLEQEKLITVKRKGKLLLFQLNHKNSHIKNLLTPIFKLEEKISKKK